MKVWIVGDVLLDDFQIEEPWFLWLSFECWSAEHAKIPKYLSYFVDLQTRNSLELPTRILLTMTQPSFFQWWIFLKKWYVVCSISLFCAQFTENIAVRLRLLFFSIEILTECHWFNFCEISAPGFWQKLIIDKSDPVLLNTQALRRLFRNYFEQNNKKHSNEEQT